MFPLLVSVLVSYTKLFEFDCVIVGEHKILESFMFGLMETWILIYLTS